jgi:GDP-L-fucose synthase
MGDFYDENIRINTNILRACALNHVPKVVSFLSTCIYPDKARYPLTEDQLHSGAPHYSNYGYAYAKRMMDVQSRAYRQQYGSNFICAVPNNLYGENDNFDLVNGHVIPALMRRIWEAKLAGQAEVEVWGDGTPLREFTYAKDIAKILLFLLENYDSEQAINIGRTSENTIREVVDLLCEFLEYNGTIKWDTTKPSGQHRKPSSNKRLLEIGWPESGYTKLRKGLKETCKWFKINYPLYTRG